MRKTTLSISLVWIAFCPTAFALGPEFDFKKFLEKERRYNDIPKQKSKYNRIDLSKFQQESKNTGIEFRFKDFPVGPDIPFLDHSKDAETRLRRREPRGDIGITREFGYTPTWKDGHYALLPNASRENIHLEQATTITEKLDAALQVISHTPQGKAMLEEVLRQHSTGIIKLGTKKDLVPRSMGACFYERLPSGEIAKEIGFRGDIRVLSLAVILFHELYHATHSEHGESTVRLAEVKDKADPDHILQREKDILDKEVETFNAHADFVSELEKKFPQMKPYFDEMNQSQIIVRGVTREKIIQMYNLWLHQAKDAAAKENFGGSGGHLHFEWPKGRCTGTFSHIGH